MVFGLADKGLTRDRGALYAVGRIVLFVPSGSPVEPDGELDGLRRALDAGRVNHFAIANPEHARTGVRGTGIAARRAVAAAGRDGSCWRERQPGGPVCSGRDTEGGIIARSLALAPDFAKRGRFALLPRPGTNRCASAWRSEGRDRRRHALLHIPAGPAARAIMERHGFMLPE